MENCSGDSIDAIIIRVDGSAYYTGWHTFLIEERDPLKEGFVIGELQARISPDKVRLFVTKLTFSCCKIILNSPVDI